MFSIRRSVFDDLESDDVVSPVHLLLRDLWRLGRPRRMGAGSIPRSERRTGGVEHQGTVSRAVGGAGGWLYRCALDCLVAATRRTAEPRPACGAGRLYRWLARWARRRILLPA